MSNEPTESKIAVTDIEISDFKDTIKINETVDLKATALPRNAAKPDITYKSNNPVVATISSDGQIKGISAGTTTITLKADTFVKTISLTVKVATANIELNETYLVMSVGNTFKLSANVLPENADRTITYKSLSSDVATVSASGLITALKPGSASIMVSSWDSAKIVGVVVGEAGKGDLGDEEGGSQAVFNLDTDELAKGISALPQDGNMTVSGMVCELVTSDMLKALYGTKRSLTIEYDNYTITINGPDIKNIANELSTKILLSPAKQGIEIILNNGESLPGKIQLQLTKETIAYERLYLYNENEKKYQELNAPKFKNIVSLDQNGKYLLTQKALSSGFVSWIVVVIVGAVLLGLVIDYIVVRKRHWFW